MSRNTFFSIIISNIKCACCRYKECPVRYYANKRYEQFCGGSRFVEECTKDKLNEREKMWREVGKHDPDYRTWKRKIKVEKKNAWKMLLAGDKNIRYRLF